MKGEIEFHYFEFYKIGVAENPELLLLYVVTVSILIYSRGKDADLLINFIFLSTHSTHSPFGSIVLLAWLVPLVNFYVTARFLRKSLI